jgi:hypothetical protein
MRKEIVEHRTTAGKTQGNAEWLDLDSNAHVQLTSEDPAFPIENAAGTSPERNERGRRANELLSITDCLVSHAVPARMAEEYFRANGRSSVDVLTVT